jgi:KDO2-lipid IV(A) lauroyltransferase
MQFLAYFLIYPFLWIISKLPFRMFYLFSDFVYVIIYYIIGYRKKTVTENLNLVFPNKPEKEISSIKKKFYKHMCDMFLEMIKSITISETQLNKRFIIKNPEELKRLEGLNKSVIAMYGHYASYEWSVVVGNNINYVGYGIYKRIRNKYFDNLVRRIRSKYNTTLIHSKEAVSRIVKNEAEGIKSIIAFLSDQSPKPSNRVYWSEFMGVKVPCFTGAEQLAKKLDLSLTYLKINKIKRGYYEAELITLADDANLFDDFQITDKFTKELEQQIYTAPEYYLWTHKRWKHKDKAPK